MIFSTAVEVFSIWCKRWRGDVPLHIWHCSQAGEPLGGRTQPMTCMILSGAGGLERPPYIPLWMWVSPARLFKTQRAVTPSNCAIRGSKKVCESSCAENALERIIGPAAPYSAPNWRLPMDRVGHWIRGPGGCQWTEWVTGLEAPPEFGRTQNRYLNNWKFPEP